MLWAQIAIGIFAGGVLLFAGIVLYDIQTDRGRTGRW
jgi:FtsH-binding integral membrane protein